MCGIAGIYSLNGTTIDKPTLVRFTDTLSHRGPDGSGYEFLENGTVGLGHRRLSILDLSEMGRQPMSFANQRYWISYNGEVFNFEEIRSQLSSLGYHFESNTDTEVVLAAYCQWGQECMTRFNGMWAFAIWDGVEKELFLGRDRFGIKPLYYMYEPGRIFAFASETRAFKYLNGYKREFDEFLLQKNLESEYVLEGQGLTPFKGIMQILPGHCMRFKKGKGGQQKRWWHIKDWLQSDLPRSEDEKIEKFYSIFRDACKIRLISDVPVATALSGGLDSSSIFSTVFSIATNEGLHRSNNNCRSAYTAVFPGSANDETIYAIKAAEFCQSKVNYVESNEANLPELIEQETKRVDFLSSSPITSISGIYSGMRKDGIVVSIDGHGVDEMMYGYRSMLYALYSDSLLNKSSLEANEIADILKMMYHPNDRNRMTKRFSDELSKKYLKERSILNKLLKITRRKRDLSVYKFHALDKAVGEPYSFNHLPIEERMLYNEFFQTTLPSLLRSFDRASMLNGVEIRMPFMDWRLVSYVFSLEQEFKLGEGYTKLILRKAMKGRMNEEIRTRTFKVGVSSPMEKWFNGVLKAWVLDSLKDMELKRKIERKYREGQLSQIDINDVWRHINLNLIR